MEQAIEDVVELKAKEHHAYFYDKEHRESNQIEYISYFVSFCVDAFWTVFEMNYAHHCVAKNKAEDCEGQQMKIL